MFKRKLTPVRIGIIAVACMFLMGQESWPPQTECSVPSDCDDGNVCTSEDCVDHACVYENLNGLQCDDDDVCTIGDSCSDGNCFGVEYDCDDGDACTQDACIDAIGAPVCIHPYIC